MCIIDPAYEAAFLAADWYSGGTAGCAAVVGAAAWVVFGAEVVAGRLVAVVAGCVVDDDVEDDEDESEPLVRPWHPAITAMSTTTAITMLRTVCFFLPWPSGDCGGCPPAGGCGGTGGWPPGGGGCVPDGGWKSG
ncbi:hypothetical protein, partial [Propionibacterium freudenreichii]